MLHDPNATSLFPRLSDDEIARLLKHGREIELAPGDPLFTEGQPGYHFYVVLAGQVKVTKQVGGQETVLTVHQPGEFTGEISMMTGAPAIATARAATPSRVLQIEPDAFRRVLAECSETTSRIVGAMAERAKDVEGQLRQQEKLAALGKLSAGLAHELNNPAAAAGRAAKQLRDKLDAVSGAVLGEGAHLSPAQRALLGDLRRESAADAAPLDPVAQSDREEELTDWMEAHDVADAWELAPALATAGLDPGRLDDLAEALGDADALSAALRWLEATSATACLLREVEQSTARISELVGSVKEYTFMDRSKVQEVDVHAGLESTLTILAHKLKHGVTVVRDYDRSLPCIPAYGSELNQVWTNLIDNAVDAMDGKGKLTIRTAREGDSVLVEIADDGPGIPAALLSRIWEPFFTTKGVGEGSGLGLDIARRVVTVRHKGDVRVQSAPGDTRFQVRLPIEGGA